ncbi:hypothetical protein Hdeb2414_s0020g00564551 [Helianthus debilis subsp. tardiflorus]
MWTGLPFPNGRIVYLSLCYSFMPNSTYPKEWKSRFIFVSIAMIPESPPLRDAKAAIDDSVPILSADEIVQWKRMYENPTRAFTFSEGILAMGGLSPFYSVRPKAFFGKKYFFCVEMILWGLLQGDSRDVKFVVDDKVEPGLSRGVEKRVAEGSVQAGDSVAEEKDEGASSGEKGDSLGSLQVKSSKDGDEENLESRLARKRKAVSLKQVLAPRGIRLRFRSASGQKAFPATEAASELPPTGVKGSLSKHLRSSSLVSEPLLRENEGLKSDLKTSQTVAAELRCQVVDAERKLHEEKGAGALLERKERAREKEMATLVEEKEELAAELKHQKELDSVSQEELDTMYAEWGITSDDNQKLAKEKYWLIIEGFGSFLAAVSQSEEFKSSLEQIYRAYRDLGYQAGLKDGYAYSAQGLGRKETPLYNSKAKKQLSKLDKESPALL